jgi:quercetin dioxygenase-like cupin family protein
MSLDRGPVQAEAMTVQQQALEQARRRGQILAFEAALAQHPKAVAGDSDQFPLVHRFAEGLYVREIFIPAGSLLTGKIHKQAHPVFLMQGALLIYTEAGGTQELHAPLVFIAPAGVKRAALALEDTVWVTVHATSSTDLAQIEAEVIAPSFAAYDAFRAGLAGGSLPAARKE